MDGTLGQGRTPDRRRAIRRIPTELSWLRGLRLRPGLDVVLVNLSTGGALVETSTQLRPGARTVLRLTGATGSWTVSGSVLRSWVAAIDPEHGVVYRGALVFDQVLDLQAGHDDSPASHPHRS
ncbi:MAG: hypothetical protein E2P06_10065 [Acidobacteria bacterium]|nr:MAG: hypothetical protein E2P06_10065 [Acidobacteriota bacterium]